MMERRGYGERGGQGRFARDAGVASGNLSRLLRGVTGSPDIANTLQPIAETLNVPLIEVLVRASVLSQKDVDDLTHSRADHAPITIERAAADLGITSPEGVQTFGRMVDGLKATEPPAPDTSTTRDRTSG
ncbi:transcriptional regulator [Streptomyces sp. CB02120-2]|nr:transcriptional regulator [Streptomyces sp. CB02120-2]